jgi:hypothetical protein
MNMETNRPTLTKAQRIEFLKMVSRLANHSMFERKLGLTISDVEFYKKEFNIESQEDARRAYRKLEADILDDTQLEEIQKARDAEKIANQRLQEMERQRAKEAAEAVQILDPNAIRAEDAERQRRFALQQKQEQEQHMPKAEIWQLPLEGSDVEKLAAIERFRKDIQYQGMQFCVKKFGATAADIKAEANRLGLKIHWDTIRR